MPMAELGSLPPTSAATGNAKHSSRGRLDEHRFSSEPAFTYSFVLRLTLVGGAVQHVPAYRYMRIVIRIARNSRDLLGT